MYKLQGCKCQRTCDYSNAFMLERIDESGIIKVADFGLAKDIYEKMYFREDKKSGVKLPYKWMALESLQDGLFSEKTDVVT